MIVEMTHVYMMHVKLIFRQKRICFTFTPWPCTNRWPIQYMRLPVVVFYWLHWCDLEYFPRNAVSNLVILLINPAVFPFVISLISFYKLSFEINFPIFLNIFFIFALPTCGQETFGIIYRSSLDSPNALWIPKRNCRFLA